MDATKVYSWPESMPSAIYWREFRHVWANTENLLSIILQGMKHESIIMIQRQESMQWKHKGSPSPEKFRVQQSAETIMASFFFRLWSCSAFELLLHKTIITGDTHASTMVALRENIKLKRRGKLSAGVLLLHDDAPTHKSRNRGLLYGNVAS